MSSSLDTSLPPKQNKKNSVVLYISSDTILDICFAGKTHKMQLNTHVLYTCIYYTKWKRTYTSWRKKKKDTQTAWNTWYKQHHLQSKICHTARDKKNKNGWHTLRNRSSRNTLCRTHMHAHAHSSLAAHFLMHNITCLSILDESIYKCVFLHTQKSFMCDAYEREKTRTQKHKRKNWTWAKLPPPPPPHTHTQKESKNFHYHCYTTYSITWLLQ